MLAGGDLDTDSSSDHYGESPPLTGFEVNSLECIIGESRIPRVS